MPNDNPIVIALRGFFGPLLEVTKRLPAPLAYILAILIAFFVLLLLGIVIPDNLIWFMGIIILAGLIAFIFTDWNERRRVEPTNERITIKGNVYINGTPLKDVKVMIEGLRFDDKSNEVGYFEFDVEEAEYWRVQAIYEGMVVDKIVKKSDVGQPIRLEFEDQDGLNPNNNPSNDTQPDLLISSLDNTERLMPLPGHTILNKTDKNIPIFTGGFRARISLLHSQIANDQIRITAINIDTNDYLPGVSEKFKYNVDLDKLIGHATAQVQTFSVILSGQSKIDAYWVDENGKPLKSQSNNLLDIKPAKIIILEKDKDLGEELDITVTANEVGLYSVSFVFNYFIAGIDYSQRLDPITFYYDE